MKRGVKIRVLLLTALALFWGRGPCVAEEEPPRPVQAGTTLEGAVSQPGMKGQPRNPFAVPVSQPVLTPEPDREIVFDGSLQDLPVRMKSIRWETVPRIRVNGVVEVNGRIQVSADVQDIGMTILRENERVLLMERAGRSSPSDEASWFMVKRITRNAMTIQLDDGTLIQGKFY